MDSLILPFVCLPFQSIKQPNRLWLDVVWSCLQGRYGHEASCRTHEWKIGHVRCRWNCHSIDHQWTRIPLCVKIQRSNVWFLSHSFHKCRNVIQTSIMLFTVVYDYKAISSYKGTSPRALKLSMYDRSFVGHWTPLIIVMDRRRDQRSISSYEIPPSLQKCSE